jgi:type IX secretion system PorP/SprF family membrane protein
MKLNRISILAVVCSLSHSAIAQQTPLFGFNSYLLNVSNPSMTRTVSPVNVTLAGRKYWTGIQGSPEAFIGSFSMSPSQYKSAFGGFFWAEKAPMMNKQVMGLNYAYAIKNMDESNNLRFGAGLDFISVSSNTSSILTPDYNDPFYTALLNNTRSSVDFRTGVTWNNELLEIGVAMQQLIQSKNTVGETINGKLVFNNPLITNGHVKYTIAPSEDVKITPLVFWQVQNAIPVRVDINVLAEKTGKLWGGAWLRPKSGYGVMGGLWVLPDVKVGYMYEKSFFKGLTKLGNSHELMVSYSPAKKDKEEIDTDKYEAPKPAEKPMPKIIRVRDTIVIVKETRVIETVKEPSKSSTPPTKPTSPKATTTGYFYIITGLYSLESNAKLLVKKLEADGYKASLIKKPDTEQFYVSVGSFKTSEEAQQYKSSHPNPKYTFWVKEIK